MKTHENMTSFFSLLVLSISILTSLMSQAADSVIHPAPKEPVYLEASIYSALKASLRAPPLPESKDQLEDEKQLLKLQGLRTSQQCLIAQSEVLVTLDNFFGPTKGSLTKTEVARLEVFFDQIRNDGDFFIQKMKVDFPRQRPFLYVAGLKPCVPKEVTGAYPSGHATLAKLYAHILTKLYPERAQAFSDRADQIANNRVLSGMHHPTDIKTGQALGSKIYELLMTSKRFQKDLAEIKKI